MKVIGYGICAPGESKRYMEATLKEFKRLCDVVVILVNTKTVTQAKGEIALIKKYGFKYVLDDREWGVNQWRIKEDFVRKHIGDIAQKGDWLICLDMDEVFDSHLTRESLPTMTNGDAFVVYICTLWDEGWNEEVSFWNVRIWRWNGDVEWERKPVHCGLAPLWARRFVSHAPHILLHYGLKDKADREAKIARYEKYDPNRTHMRGNFYDQLRWDKKKPFDQEEVYTRISTEVKALKEKKKEVKGLMTNNYVSLRRAKDGFVFAVDRAQLIHYDGRIKAGEFVLLEEIEEKPEVKAAPVTENVCVICGEKFEDAGGLADHQAKEGHGTATKEVTEEKKPVEPKKKRTAKKTK